MIMIRPSLTAVRQGSVLWRRFNSKLVPSKPSDNTNGSSPAPLEIPLHMLSKGQNLKYDPNQKIPRVTYDHQPPPKPSEKPPPSNSSYLWLKIMPSLILLAGGLWLMYSYNYITEDESEVSILHPEVFTRWRLTYRYQIPECSDHYIIELTKENYLNLISDIAEQKSMWDGHKLWSVELCQPEISIVRSYTPLPMYVGSVDPDTGLPFLKLIENTEEEGKFILYIKKYEDGEMARWLYNRPLFSEILVRGPYVEAKVYAPLKDVPKRDTLTNVPSKILPELKTPGHVKPDNLVFYAAGTGITPVLQMLYSRNPPRGFVDVYWSINNEREILKNFRDLNFFLEKLGRAKFHYLDSSKRQRLTAKDVKPPAPKNWQGYKSLDLIVNREKQKQVAKVREDESLSELDKLTKIDEILEDPNDKLFVPGRYQNQLKQFKAIQNKLKLKDPAFAFVCGPDGYLRYVCGGKDLNNDDNKDTAPITGLLGDKGWDKRNVIRM